MEACITRSRSQRPVILYICLAIEALQLEPQYLPPSYPKADSDRRVQHRLRQAPNVLPDSVESSRYPPSLSSSHPLASCLPLRRPSRQLSL